MNKTYWKLRYRVYRLELKYAEEHNFPEPDFPLNYPPGKFFDIIRHQSIVLNTKTNFRFSVKEWKGYTVAIAEDGWADSFTRRWIGWYILVATAFIPDEQVAEVKK